MNAKPKTIPSPSRDRSNANDSRQIPTPHTQNHGTSMSSSGSDAPMDENFVNDDIIEENSHVIPPTKKSVSKRPGKGKSSRP